MRKARVLEMANRSSRPNTAAAIAPMMPMPIIQNDALTSTSGSPAQLEAMSNTKLVDADRDGDQDGMERMTVRPGEDGDEPLGPALQADESGPGRGGCRHDGSFRQARPAVRWRASRVASAWMVCEG